MRLSYLRNKWLSGRASGLFDKVIVMVACYSSKTPLFGVEDEI